MKRSAVNFLTGRNLYAKYHPTNKNKKITDETELGKFSHREELVCEVPSG